MNFRPKILNCISQKKSRRSSCPTCRLNSSRIASIIHHATPILGIRTYTGGREGAGIGYMTMKKIQPLPQAISSAVWPSLPRQSPSISSRQRQAPLCPAPISVIRYGLLHLYLTSLKGISSMKMPPRFEHHTANRMVSVAPHQTLHVFSRAKPV